jgi:hypothetical protein
MTDRRAFVAGTLGLVAAPRERYNREWSCERLGYRTPAQARAEGWKAAA